MAQTCLVVIILLCLENDLEVWFQNQSCEHAHEEGAEQLLDAFILMFFFWQEFVISNGGKRAESWDEAALVLEVFVPLTNKNEDNLWNQGTMTQKTGKKLSKQIQSYLLSL